MISLTTFENIKAKIGLTVGPILFVAILLMPVPETFLPSIRQIPNLTDNEVVELATGMKTVLALLLLMVIFWITEAIHISVTAMLPMIMIPLFQVKGLVNGALFDFTFANTIKNYAHPVIGLFFGCFLLAAAMQKYGIDKRVTLWILTRGNIAAKPNRILLAMMYSSAFLSMWISNTATVAILLPIAIGLIAQSNLQESNNGFGVALMLGIAWSASVGGIGTIIGTPPNGIALSILKQNNLQTINFLDWMKIGVPYLVLFIPVVWFLLIKLFPASRGTIIDLKFLSSEKSQIGKLKTGEILTASVFLSAIILWISRPFWEFLLTNNISDKLSWIDEYLIGLFVGLILFVVPVNFKKLEFVLHWKDTKFVDWGTLILFGGGLALSDAMFKTGLASWIAGSFIGLFGSPSTFVMLMIVVVFIVFLTEITSNTAVTSMMVPVLIAIGLTTGNDPTTLAVAVAFSASLAFMLPVATPPNALVFGSGYVKMNQMIKGGFFLNIIACFFTLIIFFIFGHRLFKILTF